MARISLTALCVFLATSYFALTVVGTRTLQVTTILTQPFAQHSSLTAEASELEGYIIDLLADLSNNASIELQPIVPVIDGKYGERIRGEWDGMIRQLIDNTAQLAAAPLTKNQLRERVVTFIDPPFMKFGLSILMKRGDKTSEIQNMLDLSNQEDIKYGIIAGGTTEGFFSHDLRRREYNKMWFEMESHESRSLLETVGEGVRRVRESNDSEPFAFIGEQYMIEYHAGQEPCDLIAVAGISAEEYEGEYHLAVNSGLDATTRTKLEDALSNLDESGRLVELYNKWWKERDHCSDGAAVITSTAAIASATFTVISLVPIVAAAILF